LIPPEQFDKEKAAGDESQTSAPLNISPFAVARSVCVANMSCTFSDHVEKRDVWIRAL
jgi:hypothetical protein